MSTQTQNAAAAEEIEKFSIVVTKPSPFPNLIKSGLITSYELMEKVSELFSAAYKDFVGNYISPRADGKGFDVKLYFCAPTVDNGGATFAFDLNNGQQTGRSKKGLIESLTSLEKRSSQKLYTLTQHGREGLTDFLPILRGKKEPDFKHFVFEEMANSNINAGVYAVVIGIDINKILAAIYGEKEDGEYVQYQLIPMRPLQPVNMNPMQQQSASVDWILNIQRLGMNELNKVSHKVGIVQNGGIPMVGRQ